MTFNVYQLLHLRDSLENLGPLWSHSCFFFADLTGDFASLFHSTQNIDGQVLVCNCCTTVFQFKFFFYT